MSSRRVLCFAEDAGRDVLAKGIGLPRGRSEMANARKLARDIEDYGDMVMYGERRPTKRDIRVVYRVGQVYGFIFGLALGVLVTWWGMK